MPRFLLALPLVALALACSGGGGGGQPSILAEVEPNDGPGDAGALVVGRPGRGEVEEPGDVDFFSLPLHAGNYLEVEILATRLDQEAWDAVLNVPRLTLFAPDGTTKLLEHDAIGAFSTGWGWGRHDLDFPLFRVPETGTYFLCIAQADTTLSGGPYAVRANLVSLPAAQEEFEPSGTTGANDTPNTSQAIVPGVVHGFHVQGDLDFFAVDVAAPSILRFELVSYRNGVHDGDDGYFDSHLQLFDTDGLTPLAIADDTFFFDAAIHFEIDTAGTYFLEVAECCGVGDGDYLLRYTSSPATATPEVEPNDTTATADAIAYGTTVSGALDPAEVDLFAFPGQAGDMIRVQVFDGWNIQGVPDFVTVELLAPNGVTAKATGGFFDLQVVTSILQEDGTHFLRVVPQSGSTEYRLALSRFKDSEPESEPNDAIADAGVLVHRSSGAIDAPGDVDVFRFDAPSSRLVLLAIYAGPAATGSNGFFEYAGHGSDLQPEITVTNGAGAVIATCTSNPVSVFAESVTDGLPTAAVAFIPTSDGPFYAHVGSAFGAGGPTHTYVIEKR